MIFESISPRPERNFRLFYVLLFSVLISACDNSPKVIVTRVEETQYDKSKRLFKWVTPKLYRIILEESKNLPIKDPAHFIACIIDAESEGKKTALGKKTRYGRARGLMQIMHFHVRKKDLNKLYDPKFNISLGVKIFRGFLVSRKGDLVKALKDYNSGPTSNYYNRPYINKILLNYGR